MNLGQALLDLPVLRIVDQRAPVYLRGLVVPALHLEGSGQSDPGGVEVGIPLGGGLEVGPGLLRLLEFYLDTPQAVVG